MTVNDADLVDDFDEFMAGGEVDFPPEEIPGDDDAYWSPVDDGGVERILRRRGRMVRDVEKVKTFVADQIAQMRTFEEDRTAGPLAWIARADRALEGFARKVHGERPDGRVWKFPSGSFRLTKGQESIVIDNEQTVGMALSDSGLDDEVVTQVVTFSVAKGELKKLTESRPYLDDEYPLCTCRAEEDDTLIEAAGRTADDEDAKKVLAAHQEQRDSCPVHGTHEWSKVVIVETGETVPGCHFATRRQPTFSPPK